MESKETLSEATGVAVNAGGNAAIMPGEYGGWPGEYEAVRKKAGLLDLSARGKLRLAGKEHLKFLQGMLTNDVMKLSAGEGAYAAVLTVKGRMLSDMRVYKDLDSVLLDLEPGLNMKVRDLLLKYRLSYKATVDDVTEELALFSVQGPESKNVLASAGITVPEIKEHGHFRDAIVGAEVVCASADRTGEGGFDLYVPQDRAEEVWNYLLEKGKDFGLEPVGSRALDVLRVEAGIPMYGRDMDEDTIPIEAGIWSALSFEKGCYIGQEVVARIKWRGHVNRHLSGIVLEKGYTPSAGDEIFGGGKKIGRITSPAFSPALGRNIALGYVRREFVEPGTEVDISSPEGIRGKGTVMPLPFVRPAPGD
ncbi:MAG TPA: aminomethyltransferase family protein [Thermodesulfobacteriota bacterium]|nr:aminomethyltransferase family protein [Thermodesulfobacteriota bacterium]